MLLMHHAGHSARGGSERVHEKGGGRGRHALIALEQLDAGALLLGKRTVLDGVRLVAGRVAYGTLIQAQNGTGHVVGGVLERVAVVDLVLLAVVATEDADLLLAAVAATYLRLLDHLFDDAGGQAFAAQRFARARQQQAVVVVVVDVAIVAVVVVGIGRRCRCGERESGEEAMVAGRRW